MGSTPRGVRCVKKRPVSDLVLTATTIKTVKMLCHTVHNVYKNCLQDGVGTSPGATINSWKKKKILELIIYDLQGWASVLFNRTFRSLRSFPFFVKKRNDLCVLFRSL